MKILVVILGKIGDMILATPIFSHLKSAIPNAEIHALASIPNRFVLEDNPHVDYLHVYDKHPLRLISLFLSLRSACFDYYIDPKDHKSTESQILCKLIPAKTKVGYNPLGGSCFDIKVPANFENEGVHFISRCFNALKLAGLADSYEDELALPELYPPADSLAHANNFFTGLPEGRDLLINISASDPRRMWPAERWVRNLESAARINVNIIISYAPQEKMCAKEIAHGLKGAVLFPSRSINDLIALCQALAEKGRSAFVVSPDTSVVHIASAYDLPLIGLFNGRQEVYDKFRPLSSKQIILKAPPDAWEINGIEDRAFVNALSEFLDK